MSMAPALAPYVSFGELISHARVQAGLGNQKEFASQLGVTQQSVSRWEKGLSRPRAKDLQVIAKLLNLRESDLFSAAGYSTLEGTASSSATTFDRPLPLNALSPISFERFCTYFLECLYREQNGRVTMYGGQGHDQAGTDIIARGAFGTHSFQCKRVEEFGAQKVHTAVATHTLEADRKFLLLANIASPKARDAILAHPTWEVWDREDITRKFRTLPVTEQINIVDIFFQGQRQDLLGRAEAGPLISQEEFYKPFFKDEQLFNHRWNLVGRDREIDELSNFIGDSSVDVVLLVGPAGNGKTRLLYEAIRTLHDENRSLLVRFASPTEQVKPLHLDGLGSGPKLIVVDDAHDNDDVGTLISFCANPDNQARALFALRPYGEERLRHMAANMGLVGDQVKTVRISPQTREDAKSLAVEVLTAIEGPVEAADAIANATFGTPLVTVLGAQLVARDRVNPALLNNIKDFKDLVLAKLQDVIAGSIVTGADTPKMLAILRTAALVQPIFPDDPALLRLLKDIEGIDSTDATRLMRILSTAGVLFKRGLRHRLAPDLLADAIIQRDLIKNDGTAGEKILQIFDATNEEHLKNMLLNLGRLEWRMLDGDTSGAKLLASISSKLEWQKPHHVKAMEDVAYFQPRLALDFATRLIRCGHGQDANVCGMIRNASYNIDYLQEACSLLWKAGRKNAQALHQTPAHGIRILKELAAFEPGKPKEYVETVVNFAIDLLDRINSLDGNYTPFDILEGGLSAEMEERKYSRREYTITTYALPYEYAREIRERIIDILFLSIAEGTPRKAYLAVRTLAHAMRGPARVTSSDGAWTDARERLIGRLCELISSHPLHPVVLVKAASIVRWNAYHGDERSAPLAQAIIAMMGRDLNTRLVRLLIDGWGHETWNIADPSRRNEHTLKRTEFIAELGHLYPDVGDLYTLISYWLKELHTIDKGFGAPQVFITQLIEQTPGFSSELIKNYLRDTANPLATYSGIALSKMLEEQRGDAIRLAVDLVQANPKELRLLAQAYTRYLPSDGYSSDDITILSLIFESKDPDVLYIASNVALQLSRVSYELAIEFICKVDMAAAGKAADDFYMWVANDNAIPELAIQNSKWTSLIFNLAPILNLDGYWIQEFLKKAIRIRSNDVMALLKLRLNNFSETKNWSYVPLRPDYNREGLGLLKQEDGESLLRDFLDWVVDNPKLKGLRYRVGETVAGLCGKYSSQLLGFLLSWMSHGSGNQASVVAAILQEAQSEMIYEFPQFVRDMIYAAESIGDDAVEELSSAIAASCWSGVKHGAPGEPYPEDVRLEKHAKEVLATLSRNDPAYELFESLLRTAQAQIARQWSQSEAWDGEDD